MKERITVLLCDSASDIAKQITVLDAILWVHSAWNTVTSDTITKWFAKCGFTTDQPSTNDTDDDLWDADDNLDTQNHYSDTTGSKNRWSTTRVPMTLQIQLKRQRR